MKKEVFLRFTSIWKQVPVQKTITGRRFNWKPRTEMENWAHFWRNLMIFNSWY